MTGRSRPLVRRECVIRCTGALSVAQTGEGRATGSLGSLASVILALGTAFVVRELRLESRRERGARRHAHQALEPALFAALLRPGPPFWSALQWERK
jgi:hypothetical protein